RRWRWSPSRSTGCRGRSWRSRRCGRRCTSGWPGAAWPGSRPCRTAPAPGLSAGRDGTGDLDGDLARVRDDRVRGRVLLDDLAEVRAIGEAPPHRLDLPAAPGQLGAGVAARAADD